MLASWSMTWVITIRSESKKSTLDLSILLVTLFPSEKTTLSWQKMRRVSESLDSPPLRRFVSPLNLKRTLFALVVKHAPSLYIAPQTHLTSSMWVILSSLKVSKALNSTDPSLLIKSLDLESLLLQLEILQLMILHLTQMQLPASISTLSTQL